MQSVKAWHLYPCFRGAGPGLWAKFPAGACGRSPTVIDALPMLHVTVGAPAGKQAHVLQSPNT